MAEDKLTQKITKEINESHAELQVKLEEILIKISALETMLSKGNTKAITPRASSAKGGAKGAVNIREYFKNKYCSDESFRKEVKALINTQKHTDEFNQSVKIKEKDTPEQKLKAQANAYWTIISSYSKKKIKAYQTFENNLRDEKKNKETETSIKDKSEEAQPESEESGDDV